MTVLELVQRWLSGLAGPCALLDDPHQVLPPPAELALAGGPATVVTARHNISFRLRYEPLREAGRPVVVIRQRPDVFLPDVLARVAASGAHLTLTPRCLLRLATGVDHWPAWLDDEPDLVATRLPAVMRAVQGQQRAEPERWTEPVVEAVLLRGLLDLDLSARSDVAAAWLALFRQERVFRRLHRRGSPLARRAQAWLSRQPAPLCWVQLEDPTAAVRLTWLVALLQPHLPELGAVLPRLYPGAQPLAGEDATAVARVAYRLERLDTALAAGQRDLGEALLDGPMRTATVRLLRLDEAAGAARVLRREPRSGHLVLLALRTLLGAVAAGDDLTGEGLEPDLDRLLEQADQLSHGAEVRAHAELLASLLRLERGRPHIASLLAETSDELLPRAVLTLVADGGLAGAEADLARARAALCDNALAETGWDPVPNPERHKAVVTTLHHLVGRLDEQRQELERRLAEALLTEPGDRRLPRVEDAWDELIEPLRAERGHPRTCVVLVGGLSWADWERASRPLQAAYDSETRVLLAPLPAASACSLRRAVGGMRWRPEAAGWDVSELLGRLRPEFGLQRRSRPPAALQALHAAGLMAFVYSSAAVSVIGIDLLHGDAAGVPVDEHEQRLRMLAEGLRGLARSGRRDELVVVLGTSGTVGCWAAPGLALAGRSVGARCLVRAAGDGPPAGAVALPAARLGLGDAGEEALLATSRARLLPAAAGAVVADGGLTLGELAVPLACLTPLPRGEQSLVAVGSLAVAPWLTAGEPATARLSLTLTAGALAEIATVSVDLPGCAPVTTTLDLDERREVALTFTPVLAPGARREEVTVEAVCQIGRRVLRRRALCTVRAPEPSPPTDVAAAAPAGEPVVGG